MHAETARKIAARDQIERGLVRVLRCGEPCVSFDMFPCRAGLSELNQAR